MRIAFLSFFTLIMFTGCGPTNPPANESSETETSSVPNETEAASTEATEAENTAANLQLARSVFEHFNDHDWEGMAQLYHEEAEFKDPAYGNGSFTKTREETVAHYTELEQIFPNIQDSVVNLYASGTDVVVVEFISKGTSLEGDVLDLPICCIFTIKDGQIAKDYNYYDNF